MSSQNLPQDGGSTESNALEVMSGNLKTILGANTSVTLPTHVPMLGEVVVVGYPRDDTTVAETDAQLTLERLGSRLVLTVHDIGTMATTGVQLQKRGDAPQLNGEHFSGIRLVLDTEPTANTPAKLFGLRSPTQEAVEITDPDFVAKAMVGFRATLAGIEPDEPSSRTTA